ncbi:MAG: cupin domain-containing protein [Puia sp.]
MAFAGKTDHEFKKWSDLPVHRNSSQHGRKNACHGIRICSQYAEPILHYHPSQDEYFKLLDGEVTVRIGTEKRVLHTGDELHIPAGTHHGMWNPTNHTAIVNWRTIPALENRIFL